jgi:hypothetical protein
MKAIIAIVVIFGLFEAQVALAKGNESGGGGAGVVCRPPSTKPTVQVLDLAEHSISDRKVQFAAAINQATDYKTMIELVIQNIEKYNPEFGRLFREKYNFVFANLDIRNGKVTAGDDLGDFDQRVLDENCAIDWIAYYNDHSGAIEIDQSLWVELSALDQAALLAHETLYRIARDQRQEVTSEWIRKAVPLLFRLDDEGILMVERFGRPMVPSWLISHQSDKMSGELPSTGSLKIKMLRMSNKKNGVKSCLSTPPFYTEVELCASYSVDVAPYNSIVCEKLGTVHNRTVVPPGTTIEINESLTIPMSQLNEIKQRLEEKIKLSKFASNGQPQQHQLFLYVLIDKNFELCNLVTYTGVYFRKVAEDKIRLNYFFGPNNARKSYSVIGDQDILQVTTGLRRGKDINIDGSYVDALTRSLGVTGEMTLEWVPEN